ncbi:hypothetical protein KCU73_g16534, partial [Aureobasidium melanogenum]
VDSVEAANDTQLLKKMPERPVLSLFSPIYEDTGRPFPYLILDEVQFAKNQLSKTYQAIKQLSYGAVICASGTILPNQWTDVYGVISFLAGPWRARPLPLTTTSSRQGIARLQQKLSMCKESVSSGLQA